MLRRGTCCVASEQLGAVWKEAPGLGSTLCGSLSQFRLDAGVWQPRGAGYGLPACRWAGSTRRL